MRHEQFIGVVPDQASTEFVGSLAICLSAGLACWVGLVTLLV